MGTFADFLQDTPASSSPIPEQLLDNLRQTESGKDDLAVNKQTKAMGAYQFLPETVQMLHKQGIKFNPFDEGEARNAARTYLEQLYSKNGGDLQKAVAQYGGFVKADPKNYAAKVLKGVDTTQPSTQQAPEASDFSKFLAGDEEAPPVRLELNGMATPSPQAPAQNFGEFDTGTGEGWEPGKVGLNALVQQILNKKQELQRNAQATASNALDFLAGLPAAGINNAAYWYARQQGKTDQEAQAFANSYSEPISTPVGSLTQTANLPAYQNSLINQLMTPVGQAIGAGVNKVAEATGQSPTDIQQGLNSLLMLGAPALKAGKAANATLKDLAASTEFVTPEQRAAEVAANQAAKDNLVGVGAAAVEANPYKNATGAETSRGVYPAFKLSKITKDVPSDEQVQNAQVINEITGNAGQVRTGSITQNENTLRNEHTTSKLETPEGELMKEQIANEQNALSNYAQERIKNTGANPRLLSDLERGENVNSAFSGEEGLSGFLKSEKNKLYQEARDKVGNNPIESSHVDQLFNDPQFKAGAGLKGNEGVLKSAQDLIELAKTTGFKDEFGNVHGANTINAWDAVRKALNADWTPANASMIRKINTAIDNDISSAGGQDLFKKADTLHQAEKTLFGSKGIKTLFGDIDPNGVATATSPDKIMNKLNTMPFDQWRHIVDTAEKVASGKIFGPMDEATGQHKWVLEVPEELQAAAQQAKNEIAGSLAREVYQAGSNKAGVWNQNSVNNTLNARADKIRYAFPLAEQEAFQTLNRGGYLMPGVHGYEGAGLQTARVQGLTAKLPAAGEAIGAAAGAMVSPFVAPVTAAIGRKTGEKMLNAATEKTLLKQAEQARKEMRQNANKPKLMDLGE